MAEEDILQDDFFGGPILKQDEFPVYTLYDHVSHTSIQGIHDTDILEDKGDESIGNQEEEEFPVLTRNSVQGFNVVQQEERIEEWMEKDGNVVESSRNSRASLVESCDFIEDSVVVPCITERVVQPNEDPVVPLNNDTVVQLPNETVEHVLIVDSDQQSIHPVLLSHVIQTHTQVTQPECHKSHDHMTDHTSQLDSQGWTDEQETLTRQHSVLIEPAIVSPAVKKKKPLNVIRRLSQHEQDVLEIESKFMTTTFTVQSQEEEEEEEEMNVDLPLVSLYDKMTVVQEQEWTREQLALLEEPSVNVTDMSPPEFLLQKTQDSLLLLQEMTLEADDKTRIQMNQRQWHHLIVQLALSKIIHGHVSWEVFVATTHLMEYYNQHQLEQQAYEHAIHAMQLYKQLDKKDATHEYRYDWIKVIWTYCWYSIHHQKLYDAKMGLKQLESQVLLCSQDSLIWNRVLLAKARYSHTFHTEKEAMEACSLYDQSVQTVDADLIPQHIQALESYAQVLLNARRYNEAIQVYTKVYHLLLDSFNVSKVLAQCKTSCSALLSALEKTQSINLSRAALEFTRVAVHYSMQVYESHPCTDTYEQAVQFQWLRWKALYLAQHYQEARALIQQWLPIVQQQEPHSKRELNAKIKLALCDAALGHCFDALSRVYKMSTHTKYKQWIASSSIMAHDLVSIMKWSVKQSKPVTSLTDSQTSNSPGITQHETELGSFLRQHPDFRQIFNELTESEYQKQRQKEKMEPMKKATWTPRPPVASKPLDQRPRWRYP